MLREIISSVKYIYICIYFGRTSEIVPQKISPPAKAKLPGDIEFHQPTPNLNIARLENLMKEVRRSFSGTKDFHETLIRYSRQTQQ